MNIVLLHHVHRKAFVLAEMKSEVMLFFSIPYATSATGADLSFLWKKLGKGSAFSRCGIPLHSNTKR